MSLFPNTGERETNPGAFERAMANVQEDAARASGNLAQAHFNAAKAMTKQTFDLRRAALGHRIAGACKSLCAKLRLQ